MQYINANLLNRSFLSWKTNDPLLTSNLDVLKLTLSPYSIHLYGHYTCTYVTISGKMHIPSKLRSCSNLASIMSELQV